MDKEFNQKLSDVETQFKDVKTQVTVLYGKLYHLEVKVNSLQCQEGAMRVIPEVSNRIRASGFDGSSPINVFKFQLSASKTAWNNEEKAIELILSLKRTAAEILESVPVSCRNNYDDIMT